MNNTKFYIWLDDERAIPKDINQQLNNNITTTWVKSYEEGMDLVQRFIDEDRYFNISFDYELGDGKTSKNIAWYIKNNGDVEKISFSLQNIYPGDAITLYRILNKFEYIGILSNYSEKWLKKEIEYEVW